MARTAMIIRLCYADDYDEAARAWRFRWFRERVLPRILAQRGEPFDLWLWINRKHEAEVRAMHPRIQTFLVDSSTLALEGRHRWSSVVGLPRYEVQLRCDSDDLIGPRFAKRALLTIDAMTKPRRLVWFQPYKVEVETGRVFWCAPGRGRGSYGDDKPSAFLAYRQPVDHPDYDWVYGRGHTRLHQVADEVRGVAEGHCWAACHAHNDSTQVTPRDRYIGLFPGWVKP